MDGNGGLTSLNLSDELPPSEHGREAGEYDLRLVESP